MKTDMSTESAKNANRKTLNGGNPTRHRGTPPSVRSADWPPFARKLVAVLKTLKEDQYLILSVKRSNQYVQFAGQGSFGIRMETTSNNYLAKPHQLGEQQIAALIDLGWHAPTGDSAKATPEKDPDGSPNFFIDYPTSRSFKGLAAIALRTLAEIINVPHPGYLEYEAFDADQNSFAIPELGLKRAKPTTASGKATPLRDLLLAAIIEETGIADLDYDQDGDIGIRYGNVGAFVRLIGNPPYVRIYSRLLANIEESAKLLARLNEMNSDEAHMHFIFIEGAVFAISDVFVVPFVSQHVIYALKHFYQISEGISSLLEAEFGENAALFELTPTMYKH